jgi:hypothetical protein
LRFNFNVWCGLSAIPNSNSFVVIPLANDGGDYWSAIAMIVGVGYTPLIHATNRLITDWNQTFPKIPNL